MSNDQRKIAQLLIGGILFKGENDMLNFPTVTNSNSLQLATQN